MKRLLIMVLAVIMIGVSAFSAAAVDYMCNEETVSGAVYLENLNTGAVVYEKNSEPG